MNEAYVYFGLFGDNFAPEKVTQLLNIEPTKVSIKGERVPNKVPISTSWRFSTDKIVNEYIDIEDMSNSIMSNFIPIKDKVITAIKTYNLKPCLMVVLTVSTQEEISTPAIGFTAETLKFLGDVGASIDIDTYTN